MYKTGLEQPCDTFNSKQKKKIAACELLYFQSTVCAGCDEELVD